MLASPIILRLDHCITTGAGKSIVTKMDIVDNIVCSDHLPLCMEIKWDSMPICDSTFTKESRDVCKWNLAGEKEKLMYKPLLTNCFPISIYLWMHCCVPMYILIKEHVSDIDYFYTCIINCIQSAEKECIPFESIGKSFHIVPSWNEYVKDRHAVARDAFWLWNLYG